VFTTQELRRVAPVVATQIVPDAPSSGQPPRRVRRLGYLSGPRPDGLDCDRPVRWGVSDVGEPYRVEIWRCQDKRESRCRPCSARYRRRVQSVAAEGMYVADGILNLLTLTAPSEVGQHCKKPGCSSSSCSHEKCACTPPGGVDLGEWNASAGRRWNHFLTLLKHHYGSRPAYFRAVETQDGKRRPDSLGGRGALHLHVPVRFPYVVSLRTLRRLAIQAGFGHSVDLQLIAPGSAHAAKVAAYVSKYVTKACDSRDDVPWAAEHTDPWTGEVRLVDARPTYRTWSQSRTWGKTLAELRRADLARYLVQEQLRALHEHLAAGGSLTGPPPGPAPDD
jgi:hypothetical protein